MIDAGTQALLPDILRREGRSLLQYVSEAFPWITSEEQEALSQLQKMVAEERDRAAALSQFLARRHVEPPYLGVYPVAFTNINYVSLDHLWPLLIDYERRAIADLERDLAAVSDAEAKEQIQAILESKRQHLQALQALAAAHPEPIAR